MKHETGRSTDDRWDQIFVALAQTKWQIAMAITGGGSAAIGRCFGRAGASANLIEAVVPYSNGSLHEYLGGPPAAASASIETADQLARVAWNRAARLSDANSNRQSDRQISPALDSAAGIGMTCALPTSRSRRGDDRIHVAIQTSRWNWSRSQTLDKSIHTRVSAERVAESMIADAIEALIGSA